MVVDLNFIIDIACIVFCFLHFLISTISAFKTNKKIKDICSKCNSPIYEDTPHDCSLTSEQLKLLTSFIISLKENKK